MRRDQRGLSTVEYVLLFVLIIGATVGVWKSLSTSVTGKLTDTTAKFDGI